MQFQFGLVHQAQVLRLFEELQQPFRARLAHFHLVEQQANLPLQQIWLGRIASVGRTKPFEEFLGLGKKAGAELFLRADERFDHRLVLVVFVAVGGDDRRAADDQRHTGFIDEDRVHFVHDGEVMSALDLVLQARRHAVVAQVIETELGVGAISDVAVVLLAAHARLLIVENAADRQAEVLIDRPHPFTVARGEVIVHRHHVHPAPGERVQIDRQGRHQGFAFASGHFRDASGVQRVSADELHVERDHVPFERVAADDDLRAAQAAAGRLHHGERLG